MRSIPYIFNFHCCFPCFHFHLHAGGNQCSFKFLYVILRKMPAAKKGGTPPPATCLISNKTQMTDVKKIVYVYLNEGCDLISLTMHLKADLKTKRSAY